MRVPRIYVPSEVEVGRTVELSLEVGHYLSRVLRLRTGAEVCLFDGRGGDHLGILQQARRPPRVLITECRPKHTESPLQVTLAQGISRPERMDFTIQKSVELGVAAIQPLFAARSSVSLPGERLEHRLRHWRKIIVSACQQCGRSKLPALLNPHALSEWLASCKPGAHPHIFLTPGAEQGLGWITDGTGELTLLVGPEGGFNDAETAQLLQSGFIATHLGPRILRTETAAVAALSILQSRFGDLV